LDHLDFNVLGRWEVDRGPQELAYDFWWHLGHDVLISSEWGTPNKIENGLDPENLLSSGYGHQLHLWNLRRRKHQQTIPFRWLQIGGAATLFMVAFWKLWRARHPTWVGMCVSFWDLTLWSWLMANAHGAGLMVVPVFLGAKSIFCGTAPVNANSLLSFQPLVATAAVGLHTISHLIISGLIAWIVYDFIGLAVLRRSWINLDLIWSFSLIAAAVFLFFAPLA
jgi:hypothetical protein